MKATFHNAIVRVWFSNQGISRRITGVTEIIREGNLALIKTSRGDKHLLNFNNVNMIEEEVRNIGEKL